MTADTKLMTHENETNLRRKRIASDIDFFQESNQYYNYLLTYALIMLAPIQRIPLRAYYPGSTVLGTR